MGYSSVIQPVDFTDRDLQRVIGEAEQQKLRSTSELADDVWALMDPDNTDQSGFPTPWSVHDERVRIRLGELTVLAGYGGHGKTSVMNMVALWLARRTSVGIQSLEMPLPKLLKIMALQMAGNTRPPRDFVQAAMNQIEGRVWLYDRLGTTPPHEVLGAIHAFHQRGCEVAVIDSLQLVGLRDDYDLERKFISEAAGLARALGMHVFLLHHVRKPSQGGEEQMPTKSGVKGSGAITDLADNVWLWWQDKRRKEIDQKLEAGLRVSPQEQEYFDKSADYKLHVAKQRDSEFEGTLRLYRHPSRQIVADRQRRPMPYPVEGYHQ